MTYVILHGDLRNIKGEISDGGTCCYINPKNEVRDVDFNYKNYFKCCADQVTWDGNYFSTPCDRRWNKKKRNYIKKQWLYLIDLMEKQLSKKGRVDIEITDFFSEEKNSFEDIKYRLRNVQECLSRGSIDTKHLVDLVDVLESMGM